MKPEIASAVVAVCHLAQMGFDVEVCDKEVWGLRLYVEPFGEDVTFRLFAFLLGDVGAVTIRFTGDFELAVRKLQERIELKALPTLAIGPNDRLRRHIAIVEKASRALDIAVLHPGLLDVRLPASQSDAAVDAFWSENACIIQHGVLDECSLPPRLCG